MFGCAGSFMRYIYRIYIFCEAANWPLKERPSSFSEEHFCFIVMVKCATVLVLHWHRGVKASKLMEWMLVFLLGGGGGG